MNRFCLATIIAALAVSSGVSQARSLSPDEALSMVTSNMRKLKGSSKPLQLSYIQKGIAGNDNALYVFTNADSDGFIIVAADDAVGQLLLGYSDTGAFDVNNLPPSMQAWMEGWARTVQASVESGQPVSTVKSGRQDVAPIVKTKWGQDSPYNDKCPIVDDKRSVTGCVATSIAQVMNVHQWPLTGQGTVSYDWTVDGHTYNASLDFSTVTFDWDSMLDTYDENSSQKSRDAVSTLMYACGVGSRMMYSPESSGAYDYNAGEALIKNFGYDVGLQLQYREWYTDEEWDDMLYDQLEKGLPISYSGHNQKLEGHRFVIDGYASDGYYHVNWGWDGIADGYFKLNALDPTEVGIGGGSGVSGFNFGQSAMINLQKPEPDSKVYAVVGMTDMYTDSPSYVNTSGAMILIKGGFYSYSLDTLNFMLGVHIIGENVDAFIPWTYSYIEFESNHGGTRYWIDCPLFPKGEYDVYPAFKPEDGEWQNMKYPVASWKPLHFKVTDHLIDVVNPNVPGKPHGEYIGCEPINGLDSEIYTGHSYNFTYTITTDGKWEGKTHVLLFNEYSVYSISDLRYVKFDISGEQTLSYEMQIPPNTPSGEYELELAYEEGNSYRIISDRTKVEVVSTIMGEGVATQVQFRYSDKSGESADNAAVMVMKATEVNITLEATESPWQDDVWIYFADAETYSILDRTKAEHINIETKGDTKVLTFVGPWDGLEKDKVYAMAPWAKGVGQLCNPYFFKLVENGVATADLVFMDNDDDGINQLAVLNADHQVIEARIRCERGPWHGILRLAFADYDGYILGYSDCQTISLYETGATQTISFDGPWEGIELNTTYLTVLFDDNYNRLSNIYTFKVINKIWPTSISLIQKELTMKVGDTKYFRANVSPVNADYESVQWTCSDPNVLSVSHTGRIQALREGVATITASVRGRDGDITATCEVTVVKRQQSISWDQQLDNMECGSTVVLTATASSGLDIVYNVIKGADITLLDGNMLTIVGEGEVEIQATQPGNDEYEAAEPFSKSFMAMAGALSSINDRISIKAEGNTVIIEGLETNETVRIYTPDGKFVYFGTETHITLDHDQTYILVAGSVTIKLCTH